MKWLVWGVAAVLLLVWTAGAALLGFGLQGLGAWVADGTGIDWAASVAQWSLPTWLVVWLDAAWLQQVQLLLVEWLDELRGAWPGLGGLLRWVVVAVAAGWAVGVLVLLALAALLHRLVRPAPAASGVPG